MLIRSGTWSALVGLAISLVASEARGVDVTTCGSVVPAGDTGVLVADLSCAGDGTYLADGAVRLEAGARLDLAGHRLEMAHDGHIVVGVNCDGPCRVESSSSSPGQIVGTGPIQDDTAGIWVGGGKGRGRVTNVRIEGFGVGVNASALLRLDHVTLVNKLGGAFAEKGLRAADSVAMGNGRGFESNRSIIAVRTTASDNGIGLHALRRVRGVEVVVTNNRYGIMCYDAGKRGLIVLRDSTVTGSINFDLYSAQRPRLANSTCGTSIGDAGPWGVCSND